MATKRTDNSFGDSWRALFEENGWTQKGVAIEVGIDPSFFSKALRQKDYKRLNADWIAGISEMADLPRDYFPEVREAAVVDAIRSDPKLRDRLFDELDLGSAG